LGFESPLALVSLAMLPLVVGAYLLLRRRRARYAVRYTNVEVLGAVAPRVGPLRERVVAALLLAVLAVLCLAAARPHMTRTVAVENATVDRAPARLRIGLVTFAGDATVAAFPTHDRAQVRESVTSITRWQAGGGTAIGDALARAVEVGGDAFGEEGLPAPASTADRAESPVTILFLSDGRQNRGLIPAEEGAAFAKRAGIPVFTVALGTDNPGSLGGGQGGFGLGGGFYRVPDRATLRAIARTTGGEYFAARSTEALSTAYHDLGSRLGRVRRPAEVTHLVVAAAGATLAVAAGLARLWAPGLP
jgi:Ca-activated chloride channel family protein